LTAPDDARELGAIAAEDASRQLLARGVDPDRCRRLLQALERGIAQQVAAREHGHDVREYRAYVDALYARLDADPVRDELPEPPRRTLALRW
jgi:hypothetical protein